MSTTDTSLEALCHTARDISRHIAGMTDELLSMRSADPEHKSEVSRKQVDKIRDQIALLSSIVEDIARA